MTDQIVSTSIEILGKHYPIRCLESEVASLQQAAVYLNEKMHEVRDSGKVINLERIAIITALNMAYECLQMDKQKNHQLLKMNQRLALLYDKLEAAMSRSLQTELLYT